MDIIPFTLIGGQNLIKKRARKILPIEITLNTLRQGVLYSLIITYLVVRIYNGSLTLGDFVALFAAAIQLSSQLTNIGTQFGLFYEHSLFAENLRTVLDYKPNIEAAENVKLELANDNKYDIKFCDIDFSYDENLIFKKLNLEINSNDKIALVGRNGAGKTTLVKLLLRLYDPSSGKITFNNADYKDLSAKEIRKNIAVVFQDMQFFSLSIAENIILRSIDGEDDETIVRVALEKVGLLQKVLSLPNGIYTVLTKEFDEKGLIFSGGEMQKLAIARVFASSAKIIILDEPSSSLDPISEKEMFDFMYSATINKTVILITHRLSSVKMADTIYFMENGKIVESGSHSQLLQMQGKYSEMFNIQAKQYNWEDDNVAK